MIKINALDYVFIAECKMYKSLTDSTRKVDVPMTLNFWKTDHLYSNPIVVKSEVPKSAISVDWQGEGWYRVMGGAGTRIPENPFTSVQSIGWGHCKNYCPGYLPSGSHPQTPGKLVDNVKVCYNCDYKYFNSKTMCNYNDFNAIKIRHCGDYFVYYLTQSGNNDILYISEYIFRYCTE